MPFIEQKDLLGLHQQIERSKDTHNSLLDQVKFVNKKLKQKDKLFKISSIVSLFSLLGLIAISFYAFGTSSAVKKMKLNDTSDNFELIAIDSLKALETKVNFLTKQNKALSIAEEYIDVKTVINGGKVYSVQIKTFTDANLKFNSKQLQHTVFSGLNEFYAYSLGVFDTLEAAQQLRQNLVELGFEDVFVASYQDGKRIQIENPY